LDEAEKMQMHALKRLGKLKRIMDWRAGLYALHVPVLDNVFSVDPLFGLLHLVLGVARYAPTKGWYS